MEGGVGGGLAAVEARGEEVDVEEGDGQAHHRRPRPVQRDVLKTDRIFNLLILKQWQRVPQKKSERGRLNEWLQPSFVSLSFWIA